MALYRCELCGSENVAQYEKEKRGIFPTENIKNTPVHFEYKCMDCLHISSTTMRDDIKNLIDETIFGTLSSVKIKLNEKTVSLEALERCYPNIKSGNEDIVKKTALKLIPHLNEDIFDFNKIKWEQFEWENVNNGVIVQRKIKCDEIQTQYDEYYNTVLSNKTVIFLKNKNALEDKLHKYEDDFSKLNKKLQSLNGIDLIKRRKIKKQIDELYALRYRTDVEL